MSLAWAGGAGANSTGMKSDLACAGGPGFVIVASWVLLPRDDSTTQRRSMLAFRPLASAIAALDTPGARQAATTWRLNSSLYRA